MDDVTLLRLFMRDFGGGAPFETLCKKDGLVGVVG